MNTVSTGLSDCQDCYFDLFLKQHLENQNL